MSDPVLDHMDDPGSRDVSSRKKVLAKVENPCYY
jgi:hypothetical protein